MKKTNLYALLLLLFITMLACNDDNLDVVPRDKFSDANVWVDEGASDLFLNDVYNRIMPDFNNTYDPIENWSDNAICGYAWPRSRNTIQRSLQNPTNNPFAHISDYLRWDVVYNNIRRTNVFIKNVTESTALSDDFKKLRLAEARFLRAYAYQWLYMTYGGVPLIEVPLDRVEQGEDIFYPRSTAEETVQFITSECAAIYVDLPTTPEQGRIGKGAAMALKGWVELYAGKWADAAASNKKIMDELDYDLHPDYEGFFLLKPGEANVEGILYRQYFPPAKGGRLDGFIGPTFTDGGAETSWGGCNPTQELVDDYAMDNGKPIDDPTSGYDPQNPYENREPRFYQSIVYNGSYFYNHTFSMVEGSKNAIDLTDKDDATQTGYYFRKRLDDKTLTLGAANWNGRTSYQNYNCFRYAEVLLNYAEAQNEAVGPDLSVYDAVNEVRDRAGIPDLPLGLSQDDMRTAIRRERRVELAFEDKRFWDLLRWKTAEVNINKPLTGVKITEGPTGLVYEYVDATGGDRQFDASKNYLFPIPQSAIEANSELQGDQNPGY
ncbi:RagB/SusD family nutrient uptake outer membrane protein [Aestuariivivens insulae]|uniref:RagB/SusD family nutrient uptake outer membrane protein n=1 Tax=Aestuariivivens insulae TaxID=1621988 RepID=UPI001F5694E3|nr:RagB/SusD family nutrient uptake outer membrane protein [Aestuariivivens insulae]